MDRRSGSPVLSRLKSNNTTASAGGSYDASPSMSPMNRHVLSGSAGVGNFRWAQNNAARAAAQRLARVMAQSNDDGHGESIPIPRGFSGNPGNGNSANANSATRKFLMTTKESLMQNSAITRGQN